MDLAIKDGDFLTDSRGRPIYISGMEELLQRVLIRLCVKKGSFVYDVTLGSDLYKLKPSDKDLNSKALTYVREALYKMPQVSVTGVNLKIDKSNEKMDIKVKLTSNGKTGEVEIKQ